MRFDGILNSVLSLEKFYFYQRLIRIEGLGLRSNKKTIKLASAEKEQVQPIKNIDNSGQYGITNDDDGAVSGIFSSVSRPSSPLTKCSCDDRDHEHQADDADGDNHDG